MGRLMRALFGKLALRSERLDGEYPLSFYTELALRCSLVKTAWYSIRFRGVVAVGRGSRVRVHRTARLVLAPGSTLVIGMAHDTPAGAVLRMRPRSRLEVDGRVQIMRGCAVTAGYDATLRIGAGTFLNDGSAVWCDGATTIGPACAISWGVRILDSDRHRMMRDGEPGPDGPLGTGQPSPGGPLRIGGGCWIGANALITKGAQLGDGAVVAAGAVVTSPVPPRSLVAGVPATVRRENVSWVR